MKLKQIIEDQINMILTEVEVIDDINLRVQRRIELVDILSNNLSIDTIKTSSKSSKEAVSKTNKKDTKETVVSEEIPKEEQTQEQIEEVVQEIVEQETHEEITSDDIDSKLGESEPAVYTATNEAGESVDVTDEVKLLVTAGDLTLEEKLQQALLIKEYQLQAVYPTLNSLKDTYNKFLLAYYLVELGLEGLNAWVESFTSGTCNDLDTYINDANVDALVEYIQTNG